MTVGVLVTTGPLKWAEGDLCTLGYAVGLLHVWLFFNVWPDVDGF